MITTPAAAIFKLVPSVKRADVTLTWFASVYAALVVFWARRFGTRCIVVVGGVDVARMPEIGYGIWNSRWKGAFSGYAVRNADHVLVVDPSQTEQAKMLAQYNGKNITYVPTGYDADFWHPEGPKQQMVLCVAKCETVERASVKGVPKLLEVAKRLSSVPFVLIGVNEELLAQLGVTPPDNVRILPPVPKEVLRQHYQAAKVYCQPSLMEGLPNSVCEAMLCEAIPVGTDVGGMRRAIGEHGFLVPSNSAELLAEAIQKALKAPAETGRAGRMHIAREFHLQRREEALMKIIGQKTP